MTWRSCIASSRAACVFGGVRLISSASRMLVKIGPFDEAELAPARLGLVEDVGAGDVRRHQVGRELDAVELQVEDLGERADTSSVLASPGTPTSRQCPPVKMAARICSMTCVLADDHLVQLVDHHLAVLA